jgi:DNA invertase Pin-like site-specific DNA recombinase
MNCLKALRADDVLIVWRLDRLGRNLPDLVRLVGELESGKVGLESITEKIEPFHTPPGSSPMFSPR